MALIILDVDETLIHACPEWIGRKPDFMAADQMIFIRPYAKALIRLALRQHQVAIWTASYGQYTREILTELFDDLSDIAFIWDRNDCRLCSDESGHDYTKMGEPPALLGRHSQFDNSGILIVTPKCEPPRSTLRKNNDRSMQHKSYEVRM